MGAPFGERLADAARKMPGTIDPEMHRRKAFYRIVRRSGLAREWPGTELHLIPG